MTNENKQASPTWPYVLAFAHIMEGKLAKNRHKGDRPAWLVEDYAWLLGRVRQEADELERAINDGDPVGMGKEAADVANFSLMIADKAGQLIPTIPCESEEHEDEPGEWTNHGNEVEFDGVEFHHVDDDIYTGIVCESDGDAEIAVIAHNAALAYYRERVKELEGKIAQAVADEQERCAKLMDVMMKEMLYGRKPSVYQLVRNMGYTKEEAQETVDSFGNAIRATK